MEKIEYVSKFNHFVIHLVAVNTCKCVHEPHEQRAKMLKRIHLEGSKTLYACTGDETL